MLVRDWMMKDPPAVDPQTPVLTARRLLRDCRIPHVPVVEEGRLVGIVTDRELRLSPPSSLASPVSHRIAASLLDKLPVAAVMRHDVITTTPSTAITTAACLLLCEHLRALPVVAGGILVGLLSQHDVLQALLTAAEIGALGADPLRSGSEAGRAIERSGDAPRSLPKQFRVGAGTNGNGEEATGSWMVLEGAAGAARWLYGRLCGRTATGRERGATGDEKVGRP